MVVPLTKSQKAHALRIPIGILKEYEAKANISQLKTIDTRRLESKIGFLAKEDFNKIKKAIRNMFR